MNESIFYSSLRYTRKNFDKFICLSSKVQKEFILINTKIIRSKYLKAVQKYDLEVSELLSRGHPEGHQFIIEILKFWQYMPINTQEDITDMLFWLFDLMSIYDNCEEEFEIFKLLLKYIDFATIDDHNSVAYASANKKAIGVTVVKILIEAGAYIPDEAIELACQINNIQTTKLLLENGADPNDRNGSALTYAIEHDNYDLIKLLLENGANPNVDNARSLALACSNGKIGIVELLFSHGARITEDINDELLLSADSPKLINLLIKHGAEL